jgi:hypothetical protein
MKTRFVSHPVYQEFSSGEGAASGGGGGGGGDAAGATAGADALAAVQRPDYIAEKFWKEGKADVEALGRSYQELETAFSKKNPHAADLPKDAAGYVLKPEKIPEGLGWSDEAAGQFAEVFHRNGVGAGAARNIVEAFMETEAASMTAAGSAYEARLKEGREKLTRQWGGEEAFEQRVSEINSLVTGALGEDPQDAQLFSDPRVVGFLGRVVDLLGEDAKAALNSVAGDGNFSDGPQLANRIMRNTNHPEHAKYLAGDGETVRKVMRLLEGRGE